MSERFNEAELAWLFLGLDAVINDMYEREPLTVYQKLRLYAIQTGCSEKFLERITKDFIGLSEAVAEAELDALQESRAD